MIVTHAITYKPQRYSGIGLLNEDREVGSFPNNMSYNETLNVYFHVMNHEGATQRYIVKMHMGNQTTIIDPVNGVDATANQTFQRIVDHDKTWEQNVSVSFDISNVGMKKIIFELWLYDLSSSQFMFLNQTVHIWIEISL